MAITVRDIIALKEFESFKLVAGEGGLDNRVSNTGFLDYEYALQDDESPRKWDFRKYDFVITSLLFAKDRPEILMQAIKDLCHDQIAALAIKNVCYTELPEDVITYANEHNLPVFMFGRDDAYYEDIVVTLKEKIRERDNLERQEYQIDLFLKDELDLKAQRELNQELLPNRTRSYRIMYAYVKGNPETIRDYRKYYPGKRSFSGKKDTFYYKHGCFMVYSLKAEDHLNNNKEDNLNDCREFMKNRLLLKLDNYWIGLGELKDDPEDLHDAMIEAICSAQYGRLCEQDLVSFQNLGIYQMLLPCYRNKWFERYRDSIVSRIRKYDLENDGDLYNTAIEYVKNYGNIQLVADHLHTHKNTVRYRMSKVQEVSGLQEDPSFNIQLFIAFMIDELKHWYGEL